MKKYSIKDLSVRFGLPASTLRYYEEVGLLQNVVHNEHNQRVFCDEHICRLEAIQCFKQTGLPLRKIKEFFSYDENIKEHLPEMILLLTEQEKKTLEQIEELQKGLAHIQHKIRFYQGIKDAEEKGKAWPDWEECE